MPPGGGSWCHLALGPSHQPHCCCCCMCNNHKLLRLLPQSKEMVPPLSCANLNERDATHAGEGEGRVLGGRS